MNALLHLKWQDVADILLISFLAQRFFLLFRGTTTLRIGVGLLCLWAIQVVSLAAGMVLTSWLLNSLATAAVLVIVVIFRNEIREVLLHADPIRWVPGRSDQSGSSELLEVAEAAFRLAATRTGALLVFQDRDRIREHVREGVALGGRFSPQIIESIFAKASPVHDGAVLIQNHRIERVGAFLPLSRRAGLPAEFGTRHRAAIGLSDVCDAVVVVVSEERGDVSVVHRGEVDHVASPEQLERSLRRLLRAEEPGAGTRRRLKKAVRQASGFLLTLVLVSILWSIQAGQQPSLTTVTTQLDFRDLPPDLELMHVSEEEVEVQITGHRFLVAALKPEQVRASVELHHARPGTGQRVRLGARNIELPPGLEVGQVNPSLLVLDLERRIEKVVPVRPQLEGDPPAGYLVDKIVVQPATLKVAGPESAVRPLTGLSTEPVNLRHVSPQNPRSPVDVAVVLFPVAMRLAEGQTRQVRVFIHLKPAPPPRPGP